jgi:peroxiredoxin
MDEARDIRSRRRVDGITAVMAVVTVASLVGAAWLRTRHQPANEPPTVGALAPPLRLLDPTTSEPIVLVGLRGKVVWVVFWSAEKPAGGSSLAAFQPAWNSLKAQGRFAMLAAAVEADKPDHVRAVAAENYVTLPVYLASAETRQRFGTLDVELPLSVLIDADGHIAALARGTSPQTIERIANQARRLLDGLGPADDLRFASGHAGSIDASGCWLPSTSLPVVSIASPGHTDRIEREERTHLCPGRKKGRSAISLYPIMTSACRLNNRHKKIVATQCQDASYACRLNNRNTLTICHISLMYKYLCRVG